MGKQSRRKRGATKPGVSSSSSLATGRREIFARIQRSVVAIAAAPQGTDGNPGALTSAPAHGYQVVGTGFVIGEEGWIMTARHVVDPWPPRDDTGAPAPVYRRPFIMAQRDIDIGDLGKRYSVRTFCAEVVPFLAMEHEDIVLLRVLGDLIPEERGNFQPLRLGNTAVSAGDEIAICGFPYGLQLHQGRTFNPSFSAGIISAVLPAPTKQYSDIDYVQFDAVCNSGNSGGPIFSTRTGEVIGIVNFTHMNRHRVPHIHTPVGETATQLVDGKIEVPIGLSQGLFIGRAATLLSDARAAWDAGKKDALAKKALEQPESSK